MSNRVTRGVSTGGGGGTPAGANTQIQWNNNGVFGASSNFTYDESSGDGVLYLASGTPTFLMTELVSNGTVTFNQSSGDGNFSIDNVSSTSLMSLNPSGGQVNIGTGISFTETSIDMNTGGDGIFAHDDGSAGFTIGGVNTIGFQSGNAILYNSDGSGGLHVATGGDTYIEHALHVAGLYYDGTDSGGNNLDMLTSNGGSATLWKSASTLGLVTDIATADLTTQSAAKTATTIFTPTVTGMYRVSIYLQITRAASTSSVLGGATGVVITYNDGDGNVAQSDTVALMNPSGAIAVTSAVNTTATNLNGTMVIYAKTGVAIQYSIGYTSVGVTSMQYAAHLKVEKL